MAEEEKHVGEFGKMSEGDITLSFFWLVSMSIPQVLVNRGVFGVLGGEGKYHVLHECLCPYIQIPDMGSLLV